jgi:starvation-inducible outer membrane lipoprotein
MKQGMIILVLCFLLSGCKTVNEAVSAPSQVIGGVLAVPQSITQGVNSGYTTQTGTSQSNPYGR